MSKLVGASRAEREALAVMSEPVQFTGKNAYAAIWLLDYPIPADEVNAVMAEDVRRLTGHARSTPGEKSKGDKSVAQTRYPTDGPDRAIRARLCKPWEDCMTKVQANLPEYGKWVDTYAAWFARASQATHGDHLTNL
jgi:hypothetical protein